MVKAREFLDEKFEIFKRAKDFAQPKSPDFYKDQAKKFVAGISPWIFNQATREDFNEAEVTVYFKAGGLKQEAAFSKLGASLFRAQARRLIQQELTSWKDF